MSEKRTMRKADLKIVMIGNSSVGKTCLVLRYIDRQFQETICSIGASFVLKPWGHYNIAIWDTAGGERYTGLSTFYYRNAAAAVLAFDLTDHQSFESLSQVYLPILNNSSSAKLKVVVGTKRDLIRSNRRQVTEEEGVELAKKLNPQIDPGNGVIPYFETSSKNGLNVDEMFEYIFQYFYPNGGTEPRPLSGEDRNILLTNNNASTKKNSYSCC
ncbi:ras-related protein Rab-24-like [Uloborus diversus]|uniref:ras-related protein Rab-24-like n=1 Tax=Uloborus diversus TaxID=327109 RepID=UPI002409DC84|nr:ras-related protein Rab-24-like [Uloborus diversus]